jgi:retron-type reverse transcriptase
MLLEEILSRENMQAAYRRVKANKGSHGIDGMSIEALPEFLKENWQEIRDKILKGEYRPQPVRRVEIPKPDGGVRLLGIPTVLDRVIQQAIHQRLELIFDPAFSENSYGFRKNRSAKQLVTRSRSLLAMQPERY